MKLDKIFLLLWLKQGHVSIGVLVTTLGSYMYVVMDQHHTLFGFVSNELYSELSWNGSISHSYTKWKLLAFSLQWNWGQ